MDVISDANFFVLIHHSMFFVRYSMFPNIEQGTGNYEFRSKKGHKHGYANHILTSIHLLPPEFHPESHQPPPSSIQPFGKLSLPPAHRWNQGNFVVFV